jgi:hypothetical protein
MMSETRARASLLARWLGSLERNGLRGRRAPPSALAGDELGAGAGGRGVAGGLDGGDDGTNGVADGPDDVEVGATGGADGTGAPGDCGRTEGGVGGVLNSGSPVEGDGGVAVAVTDDRSIDSGLGRGAAGASTGLGCAGGEAGVRWIGGAAGVRCCPCVGGAAGVRREADPNGGGSQPP